MKKFAVLGYGTVGSGVVELFYKNRKKIEAKAGSEMELGYILDLRDFPDSPYAEKFSKSIDTILADAEITVVAECMGGIEPAFTYLMQCLSRGISVATSNKELIAQKGAELLANARRIPATASLRRASAARSRSSGRCTAALPPMRSPRSTAS